VSSHRIISGFIHSDNSVQDGSDFNLILFNRGGALEKVDTFLPNLIFMDIHLPGENCLLLTQKIKKDHPEMIICILTSYDLREYRELAFKCGVNYFIAKGSWKKIEALVKSISSDLDNHTSN